MILVVIVTTVFGFLLLIALGYKRVAIALGFLLLIALGYNKPAQMRLDAEIDRRCAVDGGIKVYETVFLPPERFDKYGNVIHFLGVGVKYEDWLGPDYINKRETTWLNPGGEHVNPDAYRTHIQVFRRSDGKLLGESIYYARRGGSPRWLLELLNAHDSSSYSCPGGSIDVDSKIFIKNTGGVQ